MIMAFADEANRYIDDKKPWIMIKDEKTTADVQAVCTQGLNLFRSLMIYLAPVLPAVADDARAFLGERSWHWSDAETPLLGTSINKFKPLLTRVEAKQVSRMVEQSKEDANPGTGEQSVD